MSAILAILVLGAVAATYAYSMAAPSGNAPSANASPSSTTTTTTHTGENDDENQNSQGQNDQGEGGHFNLTVGTTLTFSNLNGHWVAFTNRSGMAGDDPEGNAPFAVKVGNSTGSFTFKVTSTSEDGANLTITSGSFTINGTTYTVSSGHLALNDGGESGFGNGTASSGATFEIHVAGIHENTTSSAQVGAIRLDVNVGKSEYLVILGSHEGVGETDDGGD